jgi:predicted phage terminase large subunit-like protein
MNLHVSPQDAAKELLRRRSLRKSLTDFALAAGYEPAPHHKLLIRELEGLERGDFDTLLVFMPPGSAKSTYVNFLFPAWFVGRNPTLNVITASHSSELAERWGRKTRNLLHESAALLNVSLSTDSAAAYRWATSAGGEYYAVGVGVGIAGFRADLGIIDDPFGSREDAESKRIRQKVWDWYIDDLTSRLKPGARRVVMHTRWHDDDLAGRVMRQLDSLGREYRLLCLPAEAGPNDPLGRNPGEMLWDDPGGYDYGSVLRARKQDSDRRTWASLYQQNPVPDEGDYFKAEWLRACEKLPDKATLRVYGGSDYAVTADGGDYTVHVVIGLDPDGRMYLLDLWRKQASSDEWVEAFCDLVLKWKPLGWAEEQGQIKSGVGPFLERRQRERKAYCAREAFPTRGDKAIRAQSIRGRIAMEGLYVPTSATWRNDFESELLRFPAGVHDDQVDALGLVGQLLDHMLSGKHPPKPDKPKNPSGYVSASAGSERESWQTY